MIAPVLAYSGRQLRDHLRITGVVIVLAAVVIGLIIWRIAVTTANSPTPMPMDAAGMISPLMSQLAWIVVLVAVAGIVSTDRLEGYNRVLFSAPVSPALFYLQRFLLGAIVVATFPILLAVAFRFAIGDWAAPWTWVGVHLMLYALLGGLVFAWSTLARRDWLVGVGIYQGQAILRAVLSDGFALPLPRLLRAIEPWLPPFHLLEFGGITFGPEGRRVVAAALPAGTDLLHVGGYALGLIVFALIMLRLRPMGSGTRG